MGLIEAGGASRRVDSDALSSSRLQQTTNMAVRLFCKPLHTTRVLRLSSQSVISGNVLYKRSALSTVPGQGNPEIIESLPNTANEKRPIGEKKGSSSSSSVNTGDFGDLATGDGSKADWSRSFFGLSAEPFPKEVADVLQAPLEPLDVEIKPGDYNQHLFYRRDYKSLTDGLLYLPEIKYRRILNKAFGPGGWGLAPRTETNVGPKVVSREYALVCLGRCVL